MSKSKARGKGTLNARTIAITGITAAVYLAITLLIAPIGFDAVQFRLSEVMVLLCYINPAFGPGLILGCALANCFSPFFIIDIFTGTLATAFVVFMTKRTKSLFVATLWPTVSGLIIAVGITLAYHTPYWLNAAMVMIGQFVVVTVIGYPLFKVMMKNERLMYILAMKKR